MEAQLLPTTVASRPSGSLQLWSFILPVLKCAICPACLGMFGGVFAGARVALLGDERFHGGIIAVALALDLFILRAAMQHHQNRWPLFTCIAGGALVGAGHFIAEPLEYAGLALLFFAAVQNVILLGRHRRAGGTCCPHDVHAQGTPTLMDHRDT